MFFSYIFCCRVFIKNIFTVLCLLFFCGCKFIFSTKMSPTYHFFVAYTCLFDYHLHHYRLLLRTLHHLLNFVVLDDVWPEVGHHRNHLVLDPPIKYVYINIRNFIFNKSEVSVLKTRTYVSLMKTCIS